MRYFYFYLGKFPKYFSHHWIILIFSFINTVATVCFCNVTVAVFPKFDHKQQNSLLFKKALLETPL